MSVAVRSSPSGRLLEVDSALADDGLQANWAVDPALGDDDNTGTPEFPLRTMEALNARFQGLYIQVPMTVQLVGNVTDALPQLTSLRFKSSGSLTVRGTVTAGRSGALTAVTAVGPGSAQPWQVDDTTSGIDFTTIAVNSRIKFSNGLYAWIRNVVSATRIVISGLANIDAPFTLLNQTPTVGLAYTLESLSTCTPPTTNGFAVTANNGASTSVAPIAFRDLRIVSPGFSSRIFNDGCPVDFLGCDVQYGILTDILQVLSQQGGQFRACRFTGVSGTPAFTIAAGQVALQFVNCVWVPPALNANAFITPSSGKCTMQGCCTYGAIFSFAGGGTTLLTIGAGNLDIQNSGNQPSMRIEAGSICDAQSIVGGGGGTGIGLDVISGSFYWLGAGAAPTVLGLAGSQFRVGGVNYADITALGTGKTASISAAAGTAVTNSDATRGPGIATLSRRG